MKVKLRTVQTDVCKMKINVILSDSANRLVQNESETSKSTNRQVQNEV